MSKSLDRLQLLETFARIAERGSISAAARDLGMAQASASRQLAALEHRLRARLVERTTHHLTLTDAGRQALVEARELLQGWEALSERFHDEGRLAGPIKAVAPVALGQGPLAAAALRFRAEHPDVRLTWLTEDGSIRPAAIGCDLWIAVGSPRDDTLIVRDVATVERLVVAAPQLLGGSERRHPRDLQDLPFAALAPFEGSTIPLRNTRRSYTLRAAATFTTSNIYACREAARLGLALAVLPKWLVQEDLRSGQLIDVLPRWRAPTLTIVAAYLPSRRRTRRVQAFIAHMEQAILAIPGVEPVEASSPGRAGRS